MAYNTTYTVIFFLKWYKRYYITILFISIVVAIMQALFMAALLPLFNLFLGISNGLPKGFVFSFVERLLGAMPFSDKLISSFALLMGLAILQSVTEIVNDFLISYTSGTILCEIKDKLMRGYSKRPYQYFLNTKHGEMIYNTLMAPAQIAQVLLRIPQIFVELVKIVAIMAVLLYLNPYLTLIFVLLGICFSIIIGYLSKRYTYRFANEKQSAATRQNVIFNEFINGIKQISIYGVKDKWVEDFNKLSRKLKNLNIKSNTWFFAPNNLLQLFATLTIFITVIFIKMSHPDRLLTSLPTIGFYAAALIKLLPSVNNLSRRRMEMVDAIPDSAKVLSILKGYDIEQTSSGAKKFLGLKDSIVFNNIHFAHKERQELLRGVNIIFQKNTITAIVGDSGSGKTTLINLMLGLFQPTSGSIEVDGLDLNKYDLTSWLDKIGLVSQDTFIYHSTIKDNIAFGSESYTMENIVEAARLANAHDFISEFPDRYDTVVGERGMKLSGGQQQRIAIARAILRNPEIIILDEATSALDNISEKAVQDAINAVSRNRTVIIVAHRLSTIQSAGKIVFLKDGVIVEEGSHDELIAKNGFYNNMYTQQG